LTSCNIPSLALPARRHAAVFHLDDLKKKNVLQKWSRDGKQ